MFDLSFCDIIVSLFGWITHNTMLWFYMNKVHELFVFLFWLLFQVLRHIVVCAASSCTTNGHLVVLAIEKGLCDHGDCTCPMF